MIRQTSADSERILVTGGTGHLGRDIVGQLLDQGRRVRVLARLPGNDPRVEWARGDLSTGAGLGEALAGVDTVINAATFSPIAQRGRIRPVDTLVGIAPVFEESAVVVVTRDGLGTRRLMEGFTPNKAPGAAGKIIMKSDEVVSIAVAPDEADLICLTGFGKLIRFTAEEIPAKTAPVQGVDVVEVRGDTVTAVIALE